ncbi:MAG: GDP-L-fucose synthase [Candidatus Omnitrophica bacterium]|nr:GDP-L-fucose synthase [Candidatus Omnitrophota bacterium]
MNKDSKIFIVGHDDIQEKSLLAYFVKSGFKNVFSASDIALNTAVQSSVFHFFMKHRPEYVFLNSIRSGGIEANRQSPADFIYENIESQNNIFYSSYKFGVKKLLYLASSCVYPKEASQPIKESYILTGELEETSRAYSIAKLAGIESTRAFRKQYGLNAIAAIPATVYGPGGDFDAGKSHVISALIAKFTGAARDNLSEVTVWGSGKPRREFLYVDDFVSACLFLMEKYNEEGIINFGAGEDISIAELAGIIARKTGFRGSVRYDASKPEGVMQKLLDNSRIKQLGWKPKTSLDMGIEETCKWYKDNSGK